MRERLCCTTAHLWPQLQQLSQQLQSQRIYLRQNSAQLLRGVHRPLTLVLGKVRDARPAALRGRAHETEYLKQLVFVGCSWEERSACEHLGHDAASTPYVDAGVISPTSQKDVRCTVPQRHDLVGERVDGDTKSACETEVSELQLALGVDEEILRLEVAMEDAVVVTEGDAADQLPHEALDRGWVQGAALAAGGILVAVHVLLKVLVHVFKHEHELVLRVDNIVEADNVLVLELLHQRDLADGGAGRALLAVEVDLLERDKLARLAIAPLEDRRICALAQLLQLLEAGGMTLVHRCDLGASAETAH